MGCIRASLVAPVVKNLPASAGDIKGTGLIPGSGRSSGEGHGNPLQYSCLENPHGQRSLAGYSPLHRKELDTTERLSLHTRIFCVGVSGAVCFLPCFLVHTPPSKTDLLCVGLTLIALTTSRLNFLSWISFEGFSCACLSLSFQLVL